MLFCISIGKKAISSIERIEYIQICDKQDVKHGKSKKKKTWLRVLCEYSMYARSSPSSAYHRLGLAHAGLAEFFFVVVVCVGACLYCIRFSLVPRTVPHECCTWLVVKIYWTCKHSSG